MTHSIQTSVHHLTILFCISGSPGTYREGMLGIPERKSKSLKKLLAHL